MLQDLLPLDDESPPDDEPARRRRPAIRALVGALVCLLVVGGTGLAVFTVIGFQLNHNLHRMDGAFTGLVDRPQKPTTGAAADAMNILILGTDRRSEVPTTGTDAEADAWVAGAQRTDTMMVLHLSSDRRSASVISIPRDSWVQIPGYGMDKVNAAFSYGGLPLTVATVESLTSVRIDHLVLADWDGFATMTDILGGVQVVVPEMVTDSARGITWNVGVQKLDGDQALDYVGQRYGLPLGDLDRVRRQQAVLRGLAAQTFEQNPLSSPVSVYRLLGALTKHLSVDDGWSLRDMTGTVMSLRNLRSSDINYLTVPVVGFGREGDQSVVRLDRREGHQLWGAVLADEIDDWIADHPSLTTPDIVR